MKTFLKLLFAGILIYMLCMTGWVAMHKSLITSVDELSWKTTPWAVDAVFDAYFAFLTFYVWVAYKERSRLSQAIWFLLIMGLGNIAMSSYVLIQLFKLRPEQPVWSILQRSSA